MFLDRGICKTLSLLLICMCIVGCHESPIRDDSRANSKDARISRIQKNKAADKNASAKDRVIRQIEIPGLENVLHVSPQILSGGGPGHADAFRQLKTLGVEVILSVDGARPNIEMAKQHGLHYVHIPIGYDGIPSDDVASLTRLADEIDGLVYVHCHHGKHPGPAAAAVVCMASGTLDHKGGLEIMQRAGTSTNYAGLWRDVKNFRRPDPNTQLPELVEHATVDSLAIAMSRIDRHFDNLKLIQKHDWRVLDEHPDCLLSNWLFLSA